MKSNSLKFLVLLLAVVLSAAVASVANDGRYQAGNQPMRREIRAYFQSNVLPVLHQQRQKLEPQLSAADRVQLATYRTQLHALKAQGRALRQSLHPTGTTPQGQRPEQTDAQKQQAHQLRTEARGIMLSVAQMAQKYDEAITQLTEEVQPQKEKWATDIKAIVAKNATPEQMQKMAASPVHKHSHGGLRRFFRPATFLLMDPNAPVAAAAAERTLGNTSLYPNPAAPNSQLDYEVKKSGPVTVDLLDKNGNQLRNLVAVPNEEKGSHTQSLDLHDLPAGTYFYKITTKGGSETKRFVKE